MPVFDVFGGKGTLQSIAQRTVGFSVQRGQHGIFKESAETVHQQTAGKGLRVTQDSHAVFIAEGGEYLAALVAVIRLGGHAEMGEDIAFHHRRGFAQLAKKRIGIAVGAAGKHVTHGGKIASHLVGLGIDVGIAGHL